MNQTTDPVGGVVTTSPWLGDHWYTTINDCKCFNCVQPCCRCYKDNCPQRKCCCPVATK